MTFEEFCQKHGIEFRRHGEHHHATRGRIQIDCPYCTPNAGKFRLGYSLRGNYTMCWKCGKVWVVDVFANVLRTSRNEASKLLRQINSVDAVEIVRPTGVLVEPEGLLDNLPKQHRVYLKRRGFDPEFIQSVWEIKATGQKSNYPWRLYLPIILDGKTVSWTTRAIVDDAKAKYITAKPEQEAVHCKHLLYGEDHVYNTIYVCEGPISAWGIGPGAVATLGVNFTAAQVARIAKFPKRVIVYDLGDEAQERATQLADALAPFPGETFNVELETGEDPAEAAIEEIEELRSHFD